MNSIVDWIFSIRLAGDMSIAGRSSGKIQPQDIHPATAGLRSIVEFSAVQSIKARYMIDDATQ